MIPESPRWLISVKKFKEAKSILMEAGKQNGQPLCEEDLSGISQDTHDNGHNNTSYWKDFKALFQNSCMRKRLIVMYIEFITVVLVYNGLTLNNMNLVRAKKFENINEDLLLHTLSGRKCTFEYGYKCIG